VLLDILSESREHFAVNPEAAEELLTVGESRPDERLDRAELAAWTSVCSMILNLNESITKQ
jgi:hypothetical protein